MKRLGWSVAVVLALGCGSVAVETDGDGADGALDDGIAEIPGPDADADGDADVAPDAAEDAAADVEPDGTGDGVVDAPTDAVVDGGPWCGNGVVDDAAGEECDDGNDVEDDGCTSACRFTCHTVDDCRPDENPCTAESCTEGGTGRICVREAVETECDDGDPCTTGDRCEEGTCISTGTLRSWYFDDDGDTYGDPSRTVCANTAPSSDHVPDGGDCCDTNGNVHPGVTAYRTDTYSCGALPVERWDWNCDGIDEPELAECQSCSSGTSADCTSHSGWSSAAGSSCTPPACGASAGYSSCRFEGSSCSPVGSGSETQGCR